MHFGEQIFYVRLFHGHSGSPGRNQFGSTNSYQCGHSVHVVIVRNRRVITARMTIVRLPSTGLPYELTSTCAPLRMKAASDRLPSDIPATSTNMNALMSQVTPRFGCTLASGVIRAPAGLA